MALPEALQKRLAALVAADDVVLFMKGTRASPACGFSATVVGLLDEVLPSYKTVDVLVDPEIRDGIKQFSEWPTIPQLYVRGKFVGGCDIVKDLFASGELQKLVGAEPAAEVAPPVITVTASAAKAFTDALRDAGSDRLRLEIDPRFRHDLFFGPPAAGDVAVPTGGVTVLLDRASARRANGVRIDFVEAAGGFQIDNPNAPAAVKQLTPAELKAMLDRGEPLHLYDVRSDKERAIARIEGAEHLTPEAAEHLLALDRAAPLVFHCHHGGRSQSAAEHFLGQGFKNVYNLRGGIDAWSAAVDPKVPRY